MTGVPTRDFLISLYKTMSSAKAIDAIEEDLIRRGLAHFSVAGHGHECAAALAMLRTDRDWFMPHYRDKAALLAWGQTPLTLFRNTLATHTSSSRGRQLGIFASDHKKKILPANTPMGNAALHAVGVAWEMKNRRENAVVICSVGDGTTQQGEFLEAVAEAVRRCLPVLFLVHDNGVAISTRTQGMTCFSLPSGPAETLFGMPIQRVDGVDAVSAIPSFEHALSAVRSTQSPSFLVLRNARLSGHSYGDDPTVYRSQADVTHELSNMNPISRMRRYLLNTNIADETSLREIDSEIDRSLKQSLTQAIQELNKPSDATVAAFSNVVSPQSEYTGTNSEPRLTMKEALQAVLQDRLAHDPTVVLYGQDIEDPKGDVFGVTKGLSTAFPGRVLNAPLSESTIIGTSIGRALAGARPVAFIQFADFLPLAFNQISCELATLAWRTNNEWKTPVIIMAACGGYRPGLGPFHAQTQESTFAHVPGLNVVMPSSASDAAGLLNAAAQSETPTLFLYPKSLLGSHAKTTSADVSQHFVPIGKARICREGHHATIVTWGTPVALCEKVAAFLSEHNTYVEVIDLRSISPWDSKSVIASIEKTGHLLAVHEDNSTCGFGAEILAVVAEQAMKPVKLQRHCRPDTHIPYNFEDQAATLPSYESILAAVCRLLDIDLEWSSPSADSRNEANRAVSVRFVPTGASDDSATVVQHSVRPGDAVKTGDILLQIETGKSVMDIAAPIDGTVQSFSVPPGSVISNGDLVAIVSPSGPRISGSHSLGLPTRTPILRTSNKPPAPAMRDSGGTPATSGRIVKIPQLQATLNRRMATAIATIPQATLFTSVELPRSRLDGAKLMASDGCRYAIRDYVCHCLAMAARESPRFRSEYLDSHSLRQDDHVNVAVAVRTLDDSIVTASIENADRLPVAALARQLKTQSHIAKSTGTSVGPPPHLVVSYLGSVHIESAVPILVPPSVAVAFLALSDEKDDAVVARLCLTFDHRVINGMAAADFLGVFHRIFASTAGIRKPVENGSAKRSFSSPACLNQRADGT